MTDNESAIGRRAGSPFNHSAPGVDETVPLAPIVLFAYNRPDHLRQSLTALSSCTLAEQSELYIYCDGPRSPGETDRVAHCRAVAHERQWCGRVHITERMENLGLARSVVCAVTSIVATFGKVIVLEDDLVPDPDFLRFMNAALHFYQDDERVFQVSGYMFPITLDTEEDAVLLPFSTTWGWSTWQRAWSAFDPTLAGYARLKASAADRARFDLFGAYPYFDLLERQSAGIVDSWGIGWYLSVFMQDGLAAFPRFSLIKNIGFDGSGTHGAISTVPSAHSPTDVFTTTTPSTFRFPTHPASLDMQRKVHAGITAAPKRTLLSRLLGVPASMLAGRR